MRDKPLTELGSLSRNKKLYTELQQNREELEQRASEPKPDRLAKLVAWIQLSIWIKDLIEWLVHQMGG